MRFFLTDVLTHNLFMLYLFFIIIPLLFTNIQVTGNVGSEDHQSVKNKST